MTSDEEAQRIIDNAKADTDYVREFNLHLEGWRATAVMAVLVMVIVVPWVVGVFTFVERVSR